VESEKSKRLNTRHQNLLNSNARIAFAIDAHQCYIFLFPVVPFYSIFKELLPQSHGEHGAESFSVRSVTPWSLQIQQTFPYDDNRPAAILVNLDLFAGEKST
jgi:hypothetical protein